MSHTCCVASGKPPHWSQRLLSGSGLISDEDVGLFNASNEAGSWQGAVPGRDVIAGVAATVHRLGLTSYRAPASPQLRLTDFIRAVLAVPDGYDRVLLRNQDGTMTLFRAGATRRMGKLQRTIEYAHFKDNQAGYWKKTVFREKLHTSGEDLVRIENLMFPGNMDFFRGAIDEPVTNIPVPLRPSDDAPLDNERVLSIDMNEPWYAAAPPDERRNSIASIESLRDPRSQERLDRLRGTTADVEQATPSNDQPRPGPSESRGNRNHVDQSAPVVF